MNITPLPTRPKTVTSNYQGYNIVVTYDMETGQWKWEATKDVMVKIRYEGVAKDIGRAVAAAKRKVDNG